MTNLTGWGFREKIRLNTTLNSSNLHSFLHSIISGNKADCGADRQVRREDGERLARDYNVAFMETSAKSGLNVELAFLAVAK